MLKRAVTQAKTHTWASATTISQDLLTDGIVTHIDFSLQITPSATLAGANQPDGPFRLIDNMTIRGGSLTYFTLPSNQGGRLWHAHMRQILKTVNHGGGAIVAPHSTYEPVLFRFHPGSKPLNPDGSINYFDLSAFIPAVEESSLKADWLTTANNVMDDTVTLTSAILKSTIYMVQGTREEILQEMAAQGVFAKMVPNSDAEVFSHTATKSSYSEERTIPASGYLRGIGILVEDATGTRPVRATDEVTGVALKMAGNGTNLVEIDFDNLSLSGQAGSYLMADDAAIVGGISVIDGFGYLDLRQHGQSPMGRMYGINMGQAATKSGDWKLGLTIGTYASGDKSNIWYDKLIPYSGKFLS